MKKQILILSMLIFFPINKIEARNYNPLIHTLGAGLVAMGVWSVKLADAWHNKIDKLQMLQSKETTNPEILKLQKDLTERERQLCRVMSTISIVAGLAIIAENLPH